MKYFTLSEYIGASIVFFFIGVFLSLVFSIIYKMVSESKLISKALIKIIKAQSISDIKMTIYSSNFEAECNVHNRISIADALTSSLYFIINILANYYFFDGVLRAFPILISLSGLLFTRKFFDLFVSKLWRTVTRFPKIIFSYSFYFLLKPIKITLNLIFCLLRIAVKPIIITKLKLREIKITKNKLRKMRKFINGS